MLLKLFVASIYTLILFGIFSISCYRGKRNTSYVIGFTYPFITIHEIQPGDRRIDSGLLVIGSCFYPLGIEPKNILFNLRRYWCIILVLSVVLDPELKTVTAVKM